MKVAALVSLIALSLLAYSLQAQAPPRMEFVRVAPGEFMMGCSTGDVLCASDETPRHRVQISKAFEIGKYEVTQSQWMALMQTNPSGSKGDDRPVETVSKLEAQDFIAKLNAMNDGFRYRLPTEAEWEYAARAGRDVAYSGPLDEIAWYAANSDDETHPVGRKKPNAWGLYDVHGNVREWVSDFYSSDYYSISPEIDPTGPQLGTGGRVGPPPGGRGPGFGPGRGGRGAPLPPGVELPPGSTLQEQVTALRQQVEDLQRQLQELRNEFEGGGPPRFGRGGPGRGPQQGPAVIGPDGQLIDPLDGLPTGLPVARGGGWDQSAPFQRVSARYSYYGPTLRVGDIGFRLVREPVGAKP